MVVFPNAKINIGLNITGKRDDGYHNIETFFYPIPLQDILEFIPSDHFIFSHSGLDIPGDSSQNLCSKAYTLLKLRFPELPPLHIHLHKLIPIGGGLGGGSSDGSFMLKALNDYFHLQLKEQELINLALELGSDCPFFIINKPAFATGRGEILEPIPVDLSQLHLVVVNPGIHVNTAHAFKEITPAKPIKSLSQSIVYPIDQWRQYIFNDFEISVFSKYPMIGELKQYLYDQGAIYASMSGSGSTCFGFFRQMPHLTLPDNHKIVHCLLK